MLQKLSALINICFVLLIILLVTTIFLTIFTTYLVNKSLNSYGENKGIYVFDKD